jgi:hypothetical protein
MEKLCSFCTNLINLNDNLSGLVFNNKHFVCKKCVESHSHEELDNWTKTVMQTNQKGMPIVLWLMHEKNKDKTMMTSKFE